MKQFSALLLRALVFGPLCAVPLAFAQGSLTPPGPPGPTMKTLSQLEPRTPIGALPFVITSAGSYYLTGNLSGPSGQNGITIQAENVTLDLGGFNVMGTAGALHGLTLSGLRKNFILRNGSVTGWNVGVDATSGSHCSFEGLRVSDNASHGLVTGVNASVLNCEAHSNGGSGIVADRGANVRNCLARSNQGHGFTADIWSQIAASSASFNIGNGFVLADACVITSCSALNNTAHGIATGAHAVLQECAALSNGTGIRVGDASTVRGCSVLGNNGDGIIVTAECTVLLNQCKNNFNARDAAGIRVTSTDNCLRENTVGSNDRGISIEGAGNLVVGNQAANNTLNFFFQAAQMAGPIVTSTGDANFAIPWANLQY